MEYNFGDTIACLLQLWDWLENRRSKDNEVFWGIWKAVETKARKVGIVKAKEGREKERKKKEARRKRTEGEEKEKAQRRG